MSWWIKQWSWVLSLSVLASGALHAEDVVAPVNAVPVAAAPDAPVSEERGKPTLPGNPTWVSMIRVMVSSWADCLPVSFP